MSVLVRHSHEHKRLRSEERSMLLRHVVSDDCAPFEFHAITHAGKALDRLLAGVKGRRSPCHDRAAIMDARFEKTWLIPLVAVVAEAPVYFNAEKAVGVRI
jgi:hypothetical protein